MIRIFFATLASLLVAGKLAGVFNDVSWWVILSPIYIYYGTIVAAVLTGIIRFQVINMKDLKK